jgi:hypothetical protein
MGRRVTRGLWAIGAMMLGVGCASAPPARLQSLSLVRAPAGPSAAEELSLQQIGVSGRDDRILLARVSLRNRTPRPFAFGPSQVYVADADGTLLPRISERWLPDYYDARLRGLPATADREAMPPFPSPEVKLGAGVYRAVPVTAVQRGAMAELVEAALVRPQREGPGTVFDKRSEVILGVLLGEATLAPGRGASGYVYFYHPAGRRLADPVQVILVVEEAIHTFVFAER